MEKHYYTNKLVKMGKWPLWPLDCDAWFSHDGSLYFEKSFGIPKGLLMIFTLDNGYEHAYVPVSYFETLYARIRAINKEDYKNLEKILKKFYSFKEKTKKAIVKLHKKDLGELSSRELSELYVANRDLAHQVTIYDQFGWLAEEYWKPLMDEVIVRKLKIPKDSDEYHRVLFALTVPEEISTTLEEKRAVLKASIAVKKSPKVLTKEGEKLAEEFGWMPVFAYGDAWGAEHYSEELSKTVEKEFTVLEKEYAVLAEYTAVRQKNIDDIVKKYKLDSRDLQHFIDFGLALDGRNEAEYLVSYIGFYLVPLYHEIIRRLGVTVAELRKLFEKDIVACLAGMADVRKLLDAKGDIVGYGYDEEMRSRIEFNSAEARKLFDHVESVVKSVQGNNELKGVCASRGKAIGKARIVPSPADNGKVQEGDILITHATTVDYLPAMKKAAAIITEVGGLTCHAAVVSREFGIPCVVALKNAMKNFKDGDMVEVDADKGLVRKL
ncbi:MAG: PEP-utilizing enzyme [bacterium]|nr:PEP-utilizing enzyme [bacterium]